MPSPPLLVGVSMSPLRALLAAAASVLLACSSGRPAATDVAAQSMSSGSRVVTREMIAEWNVLDAFEAIEAIEAIERGGGYRLTDNNRGDVSVRQRRGQTGVTNGNADRPALLIDGTVMRDFTMLRQISAAEVERIEFLSTTDAAQRLGTNSSRQARSSSSLVAVRKPPRLSE